MQNSITQVADLYDANHRMMNGINRCNSRAAAAAAAVSTESFVREATVDMS